MPGLQEVRDYLAAAAAGDDQWGTAMRAGSARAAALFWQGRREDAFKELVKASQRDGGFAGFGTISLLALASRCHEFGDANFCDDTQRYYCTSNANNHQSAARRQPDGDSHS